ncbi:30S ribosomal protein S2 [Candidatus Nomurabacteria bacterium]|nr:30S ribosomal protein S2 [Candidatus Nomurabacteria bacterium]
MISNANPDLVDYPIPANDDALKAIETILSMLLVQ